MTRALLQIFGRISRHRADRRRLHLMVVLGFLGAWVATGLLMRVLDEGLHAVVAEIGWLEARPHVLAAGALLLAGGFQFSSLKNRCLTACRSPRGFIHRHWGRGHPNIDAWRLGLDYGRSCVGCCWALMLVMFTVGAASLAWMLALGGLMAMEKSARTGPGLSHLAGFGLLGGGLLLIVR